MFDNPLFERERISIAPGDSGPQNGRIQSAIDAVARRGGGSVILGAGSYLLWDALRLRSDVRLAGEGEVTLTRPGTIAASELKCDVDIGEFGFSPADPALFQPERFRGQRHL